MSKKHQSPQALFTAATAAHKAGRLAEAGVLYRQILAQNRRYPDVLHQLGLIEHQQGAHVTAVQLIREALALEPNHAVYHNNLASALIELGELTGARAAAERAIALNPDYAQAYSNLGTALVRAGDLAAAGGAFGRAAQIDPQNAIARYWLGRALQDQEKFAEAAAAYAAVVALAPGFADAHCNLGYALMMCGKPAEGARHCRAAIALSPDYTDAHNNLGYILQALGDIDGARACYERTLALDPNYAAAHNNMGNLHKELGALDEAAASYRKALELQPGFARAHFNLCDVKTFKSRDDDFAALTAQLEKSGQVPAQARYLHFALGKALDDLGAYEEAFLHFRKGNELKRASLAYDEHLTLDYMRDMPAAFDKTTLARLAGGGAPSPAPIFILGMPRSGSTLIEQILASHSQVYGGGERTDFDGAIAAVLGNGTASERAAALDPEKLRALGEDYLGRLPELPEGRHFITDKMPANFMHAGLIHLALPHAKIVHVARDPLDACLSCYFKHFEIGQDFTYDMAELGRYYSAYRGLMDYWRAAVPGAIHDLSYEGLVNDLEGETRRLLDYCGLAWEPACLDFHETRRAVQTASATQVRRPVFASSIGRWKRYEDFLGPLLSALAKQ